MPEHFDESKAELMNDTKIEIFVNDRPVVHHGFAGVEGQRGVLIVIESDEGRAWVSLKLDLDIDEVAIAAKVAIEMCDGVESCWDIPHS